MRGYSIQKIGFNKGAPRLWLEGAHPARGGFSPGTRYTATVNEEKCLLILEKDDKGVRVVSGKKRGEKDIPVIDVNSKQLLAIFDGISAVRVVVQENRICILPMASELRAKARLSVLREKIRSGEKISTCSISTGVGILDMAAHEGLADAGVASRLAFANEIREDCMEHAVERNPVFDQDTVLITAPMQELAFDPYAMSKLPTADLFVAGIPCSGMSLAGRTKRKLEHPESHPEVGHMLVACLAIIAKVNPSIVVLENVPQYLNSASMAVIRNQLRDLCYEVHETELDASDWNMLEHRRRMCVVAVTRGIEFSFDDVRRPAPQEVNFGSVMDAVDPDHSTWGSIDYLWAKEARDKAEGKGFSPTVVNESSTKVPTLNKTLAKRQSTGTFIQHPVNKNLYRIPTVAEHARCKGVPVALVENTTQTFGHETLGQAVSVPPFVSVFKAVGEAIVKFSTSSNLDVENAPVFALKAAA